MTPRFAKKFGSKSINWLIILPNMAICSCAHPAGSRRVVLQVFCLPSSFHGSGCSNALRATPMNLRSGLKGHLRKLAFGPLRNATVIAIGATVALSVVVGFLAGGVLGTLIGILGPVLGSTLSVVAARALIFYLHRDCFDVWALPGDGSEEFKENRSAEEEFVAAYLLKKLPAAFRYRFVMGLLADRVTKPSSRFPPFIALTGLDDPEGTVAKMYLSFLAERRKHPELDNEYLFEDERYAKAVETTEPEKPRDPVPVNPFASAVAVLLGAGNTEERTLVELLDHWHKVLSVDMSRDFALIERGGIGGIVEEDIHPALGFMAALALAWLHAKRKVDAGSPMPSEVGFPEPLPVTHHLPDPGVPTELLKDPEIIIPPDTWGARPGEPPEGGGLFGAQAVPPKRDEPPPPELKPSDQKQLFLDQTVDVTEADSDVDTGIDLEMEDELEIEASGEIWAGVWATGNNGPNGWDNIEYDTKFPLHGVPDAHPYALIGKLGAGTYFFVGTRFRYTHFDSPQRLYLRTNDDTPNNGSKREAGKAFTCHIKVWR
jgi:hypothetical protein